MAALPAPRAALHQSYIDMVEKEKCLPSIRISKQPTSAWCDQTAELVLFGSGRAWESRGVRFQIFQTRAGVVDHDPLACFQEPVREQLLQCGHARAAFRS